MLKQPKPTIGGQAVIEGVMMKGPQYIATAVREPAGTIVINKEPVTTLANRYPVLKKPLLRGVLALGESLVYGVKALSFSAQTAGEEEEQLTNKEIALTMVFSLGLAVVLFIIIPTFVAKFLHSITSDHRLLNLFEGGLRLSIFLVYVLIISSLRDIQRVFQYHGAEHKTIHAYEAGVPLTVDNIRGYSRLHPRCGTSFLLIVMVVSIILFGFLGWPDLVWRITSRILLMPVVAGIAYEIIRFAGRSQSRLVAGIVAPGMWLQYLTTREPDNDQIEVAIAAFEAVRPPESDNKVALEGADGIDR